MHHVIVDFVVGLSFDIGGCLDGKLDCDFVNCRRLAFHNSGYLRTKVFNSFK